MLFNRIQSTSTLLTQTHFNFATKNLKAIKLRMKAVESIKKITKVSFYSFLRPWRWSPQPRWKLMSADWKKLKPSVLAPSKKSSMPKLSSKKRDNQPLPKNGSWSQSPQTRVSAVVSTQQSWDKSRPWSRPTEAHTKFSSLVTREPQPCQEPWATSSNSVSLTSQPHWTSQQVPDKNNKASSVAYQVLDHAKDVDRVLLIYNEFKNVISQILKKAEVLTRDEFLKSFKYVVKHDAEEPDLVHAAQFFYEFYVNSLFYHAMLNNIASEQSARMNAMENASKNAGEILTNLTLEYNRIRQARITMELCEIISGASAVWT